MNFPHRPGVLAACRRVAKKLGLRGLRRDAGDPVAHLVRAMWGGLSGYAVPALEALAADPRRDAGQRSDALLALAARHFDKRDAARTLACVRAARPPPRGDESRRSTILEAGALTLLGASEEAAAALQRLRTLAGETPDYWLGRANVCLPEPDGREWLSAFNRPLVAAAIAPLVLRHPAHGLSLANIAARPAAATPAVPMPKVSVLVPVYNAAGTAGFALGSLLAQTWTNIEVVVVDDCSSDSSWELIRAIADRDPRILPFRHDENRGTYPAMNTALRHATGEFVTTHGADDWSHPEKLFRQLIPMVAGSADCTISWAVRVTDEMRVELRPRTASHLFPNVSSILFRRSDLAELGGWDEVRADADAEIYARYRARFRKERQDVLPESALSLISARPDSLTRDDGIGLASIGFGARRQYREAYSHWHRIEASRAEPDLRCGAGRRPFPVPRPLLQRNAKPAAVDVLFAADFSIGGRRGELNLDLWRSAAALGLSFSVLHWPTAGSAGTSVDRAIRSFIHDFGVDCLVAGDGVHCRLALVSCAEALVHLPDSMPAITADTVLVRVERPFRDQAHIRRVVEHARRAFGANPAFVPISWLLRQRLRPRHRELRLFEQDWPAAFPRQANGQTGMLVSLSRA